MLFVAVARGGQGSLTLGENSHVTFLLFKQRLFAPSPLTPSHYLSFSRPAALIFYSAARGKGPL